MGDFSRHEKLVGKEGIKRLAKAHVAVFGIGGVGAYAAEAFARTAVGRITLIDCDDIEPTNINRQIIALESTMGLPKVDVMRSRIADINPDCEVTAKKVFVDGDNISALLNGVSYAVDAVDTVSAKLAIVVACSKMDIPVISAMGAGNKLVGEFRVKDVYQTSYDPLARVMRRELKKRDIDRLKVVCADAPGECALTKDDAIPSVSYMPGICGLTIAGEVVRDIIGARND